MPDLPLMRTFYDELFHLTLDLPQGWQVGITDEFPLLLVAPTQPNGTPVANLGIARSVLEPPSSDGFDQLIADTKADQPNVYDNYHHVYDKNWLQDGYPAYLQRFRWHSSDDDNTHGLHFAQILAMVWAGADVLYDIHATTHTERADEYIPIIEHIIQSLVFHAELF